MKEEMERKIMKRENDLCCRLEKLFCDGGENPVDGKLVVKGEAGPAEFSPQQNDTETLEECLCGYMK